jgi:hypothetical protein
MPSTLSKPLGVRVPHAQLAQLEALAKKRGSSRGAIATEALCRGLQMLLAEPDGPSAGSQPLPAPRTTPISVSTAPQGPQPDPDAEPRLRIFAYWVMQCARRCPTGRFGDDRLLINHAWRQYRRDQRPRGMTLQSFKLQLLEANRVRLLSLVCADMPSLLDQKDVRDSEIQYLSARFHFLCL